MMKVVLGIIGFMLAIQVFAAVVKAVFTPQGFALLLLASALAFIVGFLLSGVRHGEWHRAWQGGLDALLLPTKWLFRAGKWFAGVAFGVVKGFGR